MDWRSAWRGRGIKLPTRRVTLDGGASGQPSAPPPVRELMYAHPSARVFNPSMPFLTASWPPPQRIPRIFNPGIQALAGLSSVDAANQTAHDYFLPPLGPTQRGGQPSSVSGGTNWTEGGGPAGGFGRIPAVFLPLGR